MTRCKAEDAGGLTPAKDDNAALYHFDRRTLPIFKCIDYIIPQEGGFVHGRTGTHPAGQGENHAKRRRGLNSRAVLAQIILEPVFITGGCRMDEDFSRQTRRFSAAIHIVQ